MRSRIPPSSFPGASAPSPDSGEPQDLNGHAHAAAHGHPVTLTSDNNGGGASDSSSDSDVLTEHMVRLRAIERQNYLPGVRRGRNSLYLIAILLFAGEVLIAYGRNELHYWIFLVASFEAAAFVGLGLYTYIRPYAALLMGLILFAFLWAITLIFSVSNISSVAIRVVVILFILRSLPDAWKLERLDKESL
jgi:hypothetical protein